MISVFAWLNIRAKSVVSLFSSRSFLCLTFGWFLIQASYIALFTNYRIAPDAYSHFNFIKLFVRDGLDPFIQNQDGFYFIWEATRHPSTMYHYLMSFIYRLSPFGEDGTILMLRFINIAMIFVALIVLYKLMRKLSLPKAASNMTIFMLTNTIMFTFLAASINWDNLIVLISVSIFYLLVVFMQTPTVLKFLGLILLLAFSALVKFSFVPLAVPLLFIVLFYGWKSRKQLLYEAKKIFATRSNFKQKSIVVCMSLIIALFSFMFVERYFGNIIQYRAVKPKCDQIHSIEQCRKNALFIRGESFKQQKPIHNIGPLEYPFRWADRMKETTFAVVAHKAFSQVRIIDYGIYVLIAIFLIAAALRAKSSPKEINILFSLGIFYTLVLLYVNYTGAYMRSGQFGIALQGRYIFPVLPILYLVGNYYVFKLFGKLAFAKLLYLTLFFIVFLLGGFPAFVFWASSGWYDKLPLIRTQEILRKLNDWLPLYR